LIHVELLTAELKLCQRVDTVCFKLYVYSTFCEIDKINQ